MQHGNVAPPQSCSSRAFRNPAMMLLTQAQHDEGLHARRVVMLMLGVLAVGCDPTVPVKDGPEAGEDGGSMPEPGSGGSHAGHDAGTKDASVDKDASPPPPDDGGSSPIDAAPALDAAPAHDDASAPIDGGPAPDDGSTPVDADQPDAASCPLGFKADGTGCSWGGLIEDSGFDSGGWIERGGVRTEFGRAVFDSNAACFGASISQQVQIPDYDDVGPLVLRFYSRRASVLTSAPHPAVSIDGAMFRAKQDLYGTAWMETRICLGEHAYGREIDLSFMSFQSDLVC